METYREETGINLEEHIDIEEVLKKEKAHDLFCPVCSSCISRRVILRKRRQNVRRFRPLAKVGSAPKLDTCAPLEESLGELDCGLPAIESEVPQVSDSNIITEVSIIIPEVSDFDIIPEVNGFDILKSIVYGGLIESMASLVVVSSAAGAGTSTLSTLALSLAILIGGLFILIHCLRELKIYPSVVRTRTDTEEDSYYQQLGRRGNFCLQATIAVISFLVFGSVAPITYGFSFRKSDDRDYKLAVAAAASLLCIFLLALGKAHAKKPPRSYIRTVLYYLMMGLVSSVISFLVGDLVSKLLAQLGLFEPGPSSSSSSTSASAVFRKMLSPSGLGKASY